MARRMLIADLICCPSASVIFTTNKRLSSFDDDDDDCVSKRQLNFRKDSFSFGS